MKIRALASTPSLPTYREIFAVRIILELRADSRRPGRSRILSRPQIIGIFIHRRTLAFLNR